MCPIGGNCTSLGTNLELLGTSKGYWRATDVTSAFHSCNPLLPDTCIGTPKTSFDRDKQCKDGYTGLRCEVCDYEKDYVKKVGGSCGKCTKGEGSMALVGIIVVLLSVVIFGYCLAMGRCGRWCGVDVTYSNALAAVQERSMKLRILLAFTQVCTRLKASFRLVLPGAVVNFFRVLSWFEFFDIFTLTASIECLQINDLIDAIWVQCFGALTLLLGAFALSKADPNTSLWMDFVLGFSFLIYPSMTATLFSFFDCKKFEDGTRYLLPDPTIDCDSPRYSNTSNLVVLMIAVFVVGIPVFYLALLYPVRKVINPSPPPGLLRQDAKAAIRWQISKLNELRELHERHQKPVSAAGTKMMRHQWELEERALQLGFLYRSYIPSMWYFEIAEMLRKFMLTGLPMLTRLLTSESAHIELVYGILVVLISSLVYAGTPPYRYKADQFLMLPTQFVLTLTLSGSALLSYQADSGTENVVSAVIIFACAVVVLTILYAIRHPERVNRFAEDMVYLRPVLEPHLRKQGLEWADIIPVLEEVDSIEELKAAVEEPAAFLEQLAKASSPAAKKLAIVHLKPVLEPHLRKRKRGLRWSDIVPVLEEVDSLQELKAAVEEPAAFLERLTNTGRLETEHITEKVVLMKAGGNVASDTEQTLITKLKPKLSQVAPMGDRPPISSRTKFPLVGSSS
jgi:hypothetical protein